MTRFTLALAAVLLLETRAAVFQEPRHFSSRSDLVVLHVSVVDSRSGLVSGLPGDVFTVYEDGRRQTITFFENSDTPVTVGLLIDSSLSMQRRRSAVIAAGRSFVQSCNEDDEMFTINFNERVWPGLPEGQRFTSSREELDRALEKSGARGKTALFDALTTGLTHLEAGSRPKKVLVVISDGGDNASRSTFDDVLSKALRMNAVIYTVSIRDEYDTDANPEILKKVAASTGGESFFLRSSKDVNETLERISRDIRSGYTIGYVPSDNGKAGYRSIRVEVRPADRRKVTARARSGYMAGTGSQ